MIYEEYKDFCRHQSNTGLTYTKQCLKKSFESLQRQEIFISVGGGSSSSSSGGEMEYQMVKCIYGTKEIDQIALGYDGIPGSVLKWYHLFLFDNDNERRVMLWLNKQ